MRLTIFFLFLGCSMASAQDFKKLRVGLSAGWAWREGAAWNTVSLEPSYRVTQKISIGCRLENAFGGSTDFGSANSFIASYSLNGQYYFSNKDLRAFAGLGLGFYHPGVSGKPPFGFQTTNEETKFGAYPRVGFDYGHLTMSLEYNWVPNSNASIHDNTAGTIYTGPIGNSYTALKLGLTIGGGRKRD